MVVHRVLHTSIINANTVCNLQGGLCAWLPAVSRQTTVEGVDDAVVFLRIIHPRYGHITLKEGGVLTNYSGWRFSLPNEVCFPSKQKKLLSTQLGEIYISAERLAQNYKTRNFCGKGVILQKIYIFIFQCNHDTER